MVNKTIPIINKIIGRSNWPIGTALNPNLNNSVMISPLLKKKYRDINSATIAIVILVVFIN
jgi:hypothetical protein